MIQYGLQMYSLRDISDTDLEGAVRGAAELGYHYIEFAGFYGHTAEEVKGWLDKYGVEASGTHSGVHLLVEQNIEETIRFHKTIGCKNFIIPGMDITTREKLDECIDIINYAQPILEEAGMTLSFHNHSTELLPYEYGLVPHWELVTRTNLNFEVDCFWTFNAGYDPVEFMKKLGKRVKFVHLKDGIPARNTENNQVVGMSVGEGQVPVLAVRDYALANGLLMVVESEGLNPTGLEETGRSIKYLRSLEQ